jgi:NitT/TauT family transport system ATP-binding protein
VDASRSSSLAVTGLSVRYPQRGARQVSGVLAVSDVSFSVAPGEFVAIVGPSGCGKSTLLKAIAGLVPLATGTVAFGSGPQTRVGFVFQTDALLPWSTASGNIELALRLAGASVKTAREHARALLIHVGLEHAAELFPGQLSGGMRKRVAIARALAYDPAIFLMDEPFGALDAQTRIHVGNFFLSLLVESQQTVVFVTHDIEEAVALADRVLVMSRGPGRMCCEIAVPLPRPRDYHGSRFVAGFDDLQRRVWNALPATRELEQ